MTELQSALASNRCKCQHLTVAFSWVLNLCIELLKSMDFYIL